MIRIEVQHCIDCPTHNWCSRHNQEKYHQFYRKLEAKAKTLIKGVSIFSNISSQSLSKNTIATLTKDGVRHVDDHAKEATPYPRHGAFQIRVNGVLIFSKLQSNLWPNLQKVGLVLLEIAEDIKAGRDISKFSIQPNQNAPIQDEKLNENKKVPNFKIKNRPHSSQFNATAYLPKSTFESSLPFKKSNALSLNKAKQRKSQVDKKALMRMRERKQEQANTYYNDYHDFKDSTNQEFPSVKVTKNQISPVSKKKIQFKNEVLYPLKVPFQIAKKQGKPTQLEKKPSRKLIIKASERKNVEFVFHQPSAHQDENTEPSKKQELRVEEYETEKTIEKVSVSQIQPEQLHEEEQQQQKEENDTKICNKPIQLEQEVHTRHQQPPSLIQTQEDNLENIIPTSQHSLPQQLSSSINKEQSQPNYQQTQQNLIQRKDALFDEQQLRDTEHCQQMQNQYPSDEIIEEKQQEHEQCKQQQELLEHQQIEEARFNIKENDDSQIDCPILQDFLRVQEEKCLDSFEGNPQTDKEIVKQSEKVEEIISEKQQEVIKDNVEKVSEADKVQPSALHQQTQEENLHTVISEKMLPQQSEPTPKDMKQSSQPDIPSKLPSEQPTSKQYELDVYGEPSQVQVALMPENSVKEVPFSQQQVDETDRLIRNEINEWLQQKYENCLEELKEEIHIEQLAESLSLKEEQAMIELPQRLESIAQSEAQEEEAKISENNDKNNSVDDDADNLPSFPPGPIQQLPTQPQLQQDISIHNIPQSLQSADPPTLKSIPNYTESSISLTNQVHSQLNCVYEDIQAKIEARLAAEESQ